MNGAPEELAAIVAHDRCLDLIAVRCPKCGVTCGVLPGAEAWHARCDGARMEPVDPASAARLLKRARDRRWYRGRLAGAPSKRLEKRQENRARRGSAGPTGPGIPG